MVNDDMTRRSLTLSPNAPALYNADGSLNWENSTFTNPVTSFVSEYLNTSGFINSGTQMFYKLFPFISLKFSGGMTFNNFEKYE